MATLIDAFHGFKALIFSFTPTTLALYFSVDDLFMSEEDASSFMRRDRDNYDESVEERADRLREVEENRREDASKTPKERSREKRENTRERKYEL